MRGGSAFWTEERVEKLRKLVADGHSASAIQVIVGARTRNQILGKAYRLGLTFPNGHSTPKKRTKAKVIRRAPMRLKPISPLRRALEMAPEPLPESRPDDIARVSFEDYDRRTMCGFIPGDPRDGDALTSKKYCGLPIVHGALAPYCLEHLRRTHRPIEEQPREIRRNAAKAPDREVEKV